MSPKREIGLATEHGFLLYKGQVILCGPEPHATVPTRPSGLALDTCLTASVVKNIFRTTGLSGSMRRTRPDTIYADHATRTSPFGRV